MTLEGLLYAIGQIGINDRMINFAGAGGSIYEINDLTVRDYPLLYVSPTGTHRAGENYTTYQLTLFYIDRLLEDNSNGVAIHSTAVEVLKNLIRKARQLEGVVEISEEYTITLFTETEKMKDRCNGAYAQADFTILNDTTCAIYSGDADSGSTSGDTHFFRWVTAQDTEIPYSATSFNAEWNTNYNRLGYVFSNANYEIERGWTDSIRKNFKFPENLNEFEEVYSLTMLEDLNDFETIISTLYWKQGVKPDSGQPSGNTYFYFITEDYTTVDYDDTLKEISWRTDYDGIYYELTQGGNIIDSGSEWFSANVHFAENLTSGVIIYNFSAYDTGGTELGTIRIVQKPYEESGFTFTDPNRTIMDSPAPNQIFYKTVSGVVRDAAMYINAKDPEGKEIRIISNTYPDPEGYGIIEYDGPLYQGWPFFPSDMLGGNNPGSEGQAVTEVILPEGYGVLSNYDQSEWGVSDRYLKSVYIPNSTVKMYPTDCIENNLCSLENVIIPAGVQGGLRGHGVETIKQNIKPTSACQGIPNIYYNGTIENYHKMSPHSNYWQMANTGALIHCFDGYTYQK